MRELFYCGPLEVEVRGYCDLLRDKVAETLRLYTVPWPEPRARITVDVHEVTDPAPMLAGGFLTCGRMRVNATGKGLAATCASGSAAFFIAAEEHWSIAMPSSPPLNEAPDDVEDLVGLVLTTGWRRLGLVPLHAGAIVSEDRCAILCAPSGGGKSTLAAALIRRGWGTLGDDKLLLAMRGDGSAELAAVSDTFNLHPKTRSWFPEVGDLESRPQYSAWTPKRKVRITDIWPHTLVHRAEPTHLVQLVRRGDTSTVRVDAIDGGETLSLLLRQTVIPKDRSLAQQILNTLAVVAGRLKGLRVELGRDAYRDADCLAVLESAMA